MNSNNSPNSTNGNIFRYSPPPHTPVGFYGTGIALRIADHEYRGESVGVSDGYSKSVIVSARIKLTKDGS